MLPFLASAQATGSRNGLSAINAAAGVGARQNVLSEFKSDVYGDLGVKTVINGRGTVTIIGATRMLPEVESAMREATRHFVQIDELMDAAGTRLGKLTGSEFGIVTTGATGALTVAAAGIVTGGNPDKLWKLPDLEGMKDEVIIPSYSWTAYESAVRGVGLKMKDTATIEQFRAAINDKTALVLVLAGKESENGPLSVKKISEIVRPLGIPVLVDAAAEGLTLPNPHIALGADLVAYSGGKYLNGPQCAGLLIGRKDLVKAAWITSAPHHGFGRGYKVGREEIVGVVTAVEMWWKRDHVAERRRWEDRLATIAARLDKIPGVTTKIIQPNGRSNPSPDLHVSWNMDDIRLTGYDVENILWDGDPRVAVSGAGSYLPFPPNFKPNITINSSQLEDGEELIIADRVFEALSGSQKGTSSDIPPGVNINGKWEVEIEFAAGTDKQQVILEQQGSGLRGKHIGSYSVRDIYGSIKGKNLILRSSYTKYGVRLNYEFSGTAENDKMHGNLLLGEYGTVSWRAVKIR